MDKKIDEIEDVIIDESENINDNKEIIDEVPIYQEPTNVENTTFSEIVEPIKEETPIYEEQITEGITNQEYINPITEEVKPLVEEVESTPVYEESVIEETNENVTPIQNEEIKPVQPLPEEETNEPFGSNYGELNEHPNAKIVLNKQVEEETKLEDVGDFKITDNKSLMFALIVGLIIFIAIMVLPRLFY